MKGVDLSLNILGGAIKGGLLAILIASIVLSVIGLALYGFGALILMPLYYSLGLVLFVAPIGMLFGAIVRIIILISNAHEQRSDQSQDGKRTITIASVVWIGLPLILVVGLVIAPYLTTSVSRNVRHGATWTTEVRPGCDTPAVILMLIEYAEYEVVCSRELLTWLRTQNENIVPITYRVTYDFGEPRSYQLTGVGDIDISWSDWLGGPSGCGGKYQHPCDSPQAQRGSPLYESSWPDS